jgi:putative transposase
MGGKKVNGRKRHIVVDTAGNLLRVWVSTAQLSDREAVWWWLDVVAAAVPTLRRIFADQGYTGAIVQWAQDTWAIVLEIVKKAPDQQGFVVLPRRWVVERTFAWLGCNRRMAKDYEQVTECSETWIYLASIRLLLTRLAPASKIS